VFGSNHASAPNDSDLRVDRNPQAERIISLPILFTYIRRNIMSHKSFQRMITVFSVLLAMGFSLYAQNNGNHGAGEKQQKQINATPPALVTVEGTVSAINISFAAGLPTMELSTVEKGTLLVLVAPPWYLQARQFSLNVNDSVQASVFVDPTDPARYLAAVITNLQTSESLSLRDAAGFPLWSSQGRGPRAFHAGQANNPQQSGISRVRTSMRQGMCTGNECPLVDLTTLKTQTGVVSEIEIAPGQPRPNLKLKLDSGEESEFHLGPFWYLERIEFAVKVGDSLTVTAAQCPSEPGDYVVFQMTIAGKIFVFRQTDGVPLWKSGMYGRSQ
jgi:hypothetical protein